TDSESPGGVRCSEGAAFTSVAKHVLARRHPDHDHAPLAEDHLLASGRWKVVQRSLGGTEARQVDAATVEPEVPLQLLPNGVEGLPRSLPVSVTDEQPPQVRDEGRGRACSTVPPRLWDDRVAVPPPEVRASLFLGPPNEGHRADLVAGADRRRPTAESTPH